MLALVTASLDVLPVLGVGTVLVPYALFSMATGDVFRGVGLLVLYGVVTVVRQIAEPHLVGKSLGVHPLLNLASVYAGASFFGVTGVIFMPITVVILKNLLLPEERS